MQFGVMMIRPLNRPTISRWSTAPMPIRGASKPVRMKRPNTMQRLRRYRQIRYRSGFEIGCSIGVLTHRLAQRCAGLLAVDVVPDALEHARKRCRDLPQVRFSLMDTPQCCRRAVRFIVLSEVASLVGRRSDERPNRTGRRLLPAGLIWCMDGGCPQRGRSRAFMKDAGAAPLVSARPAICSSGAQAVLTLSSISSSIDFR